ncbi:MAG: DNA repair protein [Pseudomonadota bacterium]
MDKSGDDTRGMTPDALGQIQDYVQASVLVLLGVLIIGMVGITLMSIIGVLPWLQIEARLGTAAIPAFGPAVQVVFTLFCVSLLAFLPASARVLKLERAHREFTLTLDDIERAYRAAHAEDRSGAFALSAEFNAVRERLTFLKKHPDLAHLEPEILELAAQMSYLSRDLALVYSDDAVERAKAFLASRQADVATHGEKIAMAVGLSQELKHWLEDVEAEEQAARHQLARLEADLKEILPRLGLTLESHAGATVLPLAKPVKREKVES